MYAFEVQKLYYNSGAAAHQSVGYHVSVGVLDTAIADIREEPGDEHTSTLQKRKADRQVS